MEKLRVIIVEDEPGILQGITMLMQQIGLPLAITGTYYNGQAAFDDLAASRPDIVITDVQMPVMSGLELIGKMRAAEYTAEFLVLSGYAEFEYVQKALQLGANNYLLKSPRISELKEALSNICRKIYSNRYEKRRELLQSILFQQYRASAAEFYPEPFSVRILLCMAGNYVDGSADVLPLPIDQWKCRRVLEYISEHSGKDTGLLWVLNGYHLNMKIIVIAGAPDESLSPEELFDLLKDMTGEWQLPLTLCAGSKTDSLDSLFALCAHGVQMLKKTVRFGESTLSFFDGTENNFPAKALSPAASDILYKTVATQRPDLVARQFRCFLEKWDALGYSQAEFLAMTTCIISEICRQISAVQKVDIEEDALQKVYSIAARALSLQQFSDQIVRLIEDIYSSFLDASADNQIKKTVMLLADYIHDNFAQNIDVNLFAREHGYHPVYLITQFSRLMHISPTKLMIQLRIERAKELLRSSQMSLKDVADAVGYCDVSYFSRTFKDREGISPGNYRRQQTAQDA